MATYREIKGTSIPWVDSDYPSSVATSQAGQLWYNSTSGKIRAFLSYDTWATTAPLGTARQTLAGIGTQTAALAAGGGAPGASNKTEEYVKTHSGAPYILTKKIKAQE